MADDESVRLMNPSVSQKAQHTDTHILFSVKTVIVFSDCEL